MMHGQQNVKLLQHVLAIFS